MNVGQFKNQIGSFYNSKEVLVAKSVFKTLPDEQKIFAMSEILKIAFINRIQILKSLDDFWAILPVAVSGKMEVVDKDPREQKDIRQILNLGHTLGHAIELKYAMAHGWAVAQGMFFSLRWSFEQKLISESVFSNYLAVLHKYFTEKQTFENPKTLIYFSKDELRRYLVADKKISDKDNINFVFFTDEGAKIQKVTIHQILEEATRQQWIPHG